LNEKGLNKHHPGLVSGLDRTKSSQLLSEFSASTCSLDCSLGREVHEELTYRTHVDPLPVLISGSGVEQLLRVPKLPSGTGKAQSDAVIRVLKECGVLDQIVASCFDTTAANKGNRFSACSFLEQKLDRQLLFLACRHHIMEPYRRRCL